MVVKVESGLRACFYAYLSCKLQAMPRQISFQLFSKITIVTRKSKHKPHKPIYKAIPNKDFSLLQSAPVYLQRAPMKFVNCVSLQWSAH